VNRSGRTESDPGVLELRSLRLEDEEAFRRAVAACLEGRDDPPFTVAVDYDPSQPFADYLERIGGWPSGRSLPEGYLPFTYLVGTAGGIIVGRLTIRHRLNEYLELAAGHIGYGVVPGFRRKGYAAAMLREALPLCPALGLSRVLITCDDDNIGSRKVIEACGGKLADYTMVPGMRIRKRRYWISVTG
jgi:predicted acetyltransferase